MFWTFSNLCFGGRTHSFLVGLRSEVKLLVLAMHLLSFSPFCCFLKVVALIYTIGSNAENSHCSTPLPAAAVTSPFHFSYSGGGRPVFCTLHLGALACGAGVLRMAKAKGYFCFSDKADLILFPGIGKANQELLLLLGWSWPNTIPRCLAFQKKEAHVSVHTAGEELEPPKWTEQTLTSGSWV